MIKNITRRQFVKKGLKTGVTLGTLKGFASIVLGEDRRRFDLIIKNGVVYDGTGGKSFKADVGIKQEKVLAIGNLSFSSAKETIDATELAVCPGFIDVHSHTDCHLLVNPKAESKVRQGVTTEISGNCGYSPFPISGYAAERYRENIKEDFELDADWTDCADFLQRLEKQRIAFNYATLIGHSTIREAVMGLDNKPPSYDDMKKMKFELEKAMEHGAIGLSTGLEYTPGSFASTEEIIELCKILPQYNGIYTTHMRNEDVRVIEAVKEAIQIGRQAGVSVELSHLKACQKRNWYKVDQFLEIIGKARGDGVDVHADRYPYIAYSTTLQLLFPLWSREGGNEKFVQRLQDKNLIPKLRDFVETKIKNLGSWEAVLISRISSKERAHYQGKAVLQIAEEENIDPFEWVRQILILEKGSVSMVGFAMDEETTIKVLTFPFTMIGSDGNALATEGLLSRGNPHPRSFGTFPRVLGYYVRQKNIMPLAEAIRKMTLLPAKKFGLKNRGLLKAGNFADIVIFDKDKVIDKATFLNPKRYPQGIKHVIVNGQLTIKSENHTGALSGKIIRRV